MPRGPKSILVLRGAADAVGALRLAAASQERGRMVELALVQDAVTAAVRFNRSEGAEIVRAIAGRGGQCHVLATDLTMRGFAAPDLSPGCRLINYEDLVDLLLADGVTVTGTF